MTAPSATSSGPTPPGDPTAMTYTVAAIGDRDDLDGFRLVGVPVTATPTPATALTAWDALSEHVGLVILSPTAAAAIGPRLDDRPNVMTVTTP
jgi:vacuolar-type H+-ATPase subunit F/Vma7